VQKKEKVGGGGRGGGEMFTAVDTTEAGCGCDYEQVITINLLSTKLQIS